MEKIKKMIVRLYNSETIRYGVVGVATTAVNYVVSFLLHYGLSVGEEISNISGIVFAVLFAYVTNKLIVFRSHTKNFRELVWEFLKFIATRAVTMVMEAAGVPLLTSVIENFALRKILVNVIVIIVNFFLGKLLVFKGNKAGKAGRAEAGESTEEEKRSEEVKGSEKTEGSEEAKGAGTADGGSVLHAKAPFESEEKETD